MQKHAENSACLPAAPCLPPHSQSKSSRLAGAIPRVGFFCDIAPLGTAPLWRFDIPAAVRHHRCRGIKVFSTGKVSPSVVSDTAISGSGPAFPGQLFPQRGACG